MGRRQQLAEARRLLSDARLISLVGPGGVGKTRLAVRLASDLARGFAQGGWWIDLAEIRDPDLVTTAVLGGLDLSDQGALDPLRLVLAHLRESNLLLILDNCEHVLAAAAVLVDQILRTAPEVRLIATSREPLQVSGEHVLPVPPLGLPPPGGGPSLAQLQQNEAVMLFCERASAVSGGFELSTVNQSAVAELCRRLDGLPLAIELAAVRTRVLSVDQIVTRLSDRFALLTGGARAALPRQQTLRTTIDWSHDQLTASEQRLLHRLCVFAGRFSLDDVEPVCLWDDPGQALDLMASLVDKSLVVKEEIRGVAGFRLHETMRDYAEGKLCDAAEVAALDERYVDHFRTWCLQAEESSRRRPLEWLLWVELEIDNIRWALQKCLDAADWRRGLDIATAIGLYWTLRGPRESVRWFDQLIGAAGDSAGLSPRAYRMRGLFSMRQADAEAARPWLRRAIASARAPVDRVQLILSLAAAAVTEDMAGNPAGAKTFLSEAEDLAAAGGRPTVSIEVVQARAIHAFFGGDLDKAAAAAEVGERQCRESGDLLYLVQMLLYRGQASMLAGAADRSKPSFIEALRIARQLDDRPAQYDLLSLLAWQASAADQFRLTAQLMGAADAAQVRAGAALTGPFEPLLMAARQKATDSLGAAGFEAAHSAGRRLDRDDALRLALGEVATSGDGSSGDVGASAGPLAARELDVAKLIGSGLTNKQVGARLFISDRTVATHVRNIMNKLGFDSRAQIASWVSSS